MARRTAADILALVIVLIATLAPAVQPQFWFGTTDTAWTPAAVASADMFNATAVLDTAQVVFMNGTSTSEGLERKGRHAGRPDWDQAMAKCRATGKWSEVECHEAVGNGEF